MAGYTKLFNSILASTIWREDDKTRIVWITMLAMANKHGIVEASVPGLSDFARVNLADCQRALARLSSPDTWSRSKVAEGRRIEDVEGGWRLLNHRKYRDTLSAEERREYNRIKQAEHRAKAKVNTDDVSNVNNVNDKSAESAHTAPAPTPSPTTDKREKSASVSSTVKAQKNEGVIFDDDALSERAGSFIERYRLLYPVHRQGARYVVKPVRDYQAALQLCQTWPDDRLEKLAICFLTTDHKFAAEGSRTLSQFVALASWVDGELAKWESQ